MGFPQVTYSNTFEFNLNEWYNFTAVLTEDKVEYAVNGQIYAKADLKEGDIEKKGYFGFYSFVNSDYSVKNIKVQEFHNLKVGDFDTCMKDNKCYDLFECTSKD